MRRDRRQYDHKITNTTNQKTIKQGNRWARTVLWCQTRKDADLKNIIVSREMVDYPLNVLPLEYYKLHLEEPKGIMLEGHIVDFGTLLSTQRASNTDIAAIEWYLENKDTPDKPINPEDDAC